MSFRATLLVSGLAICGFGLAACGSGIPDPDPVTTGPDNRELQPERRGVASPSKPDTSPNAGTAAGGSDTAPSTTFQTAQGNVQISDLWKSKGLVVVFYRGHWCKQCRRQLTEFQDAIAAIRGHGYEVVAVSTDAPSVSAGLSDKLHLEYALYSDKGGLGSGIWGVYSREHDLARPSVFVIRPGGNIVFKYVSDTPSDRPAIPELLKIMAANPPPG